MASLKPLRPQSVVALSLGLLCLCSGLGATGEALAWGKKASGSATTTQNAPNDTSWRAPSTAERAAALRAEPLVKATFFSRLFDHNPRDTESGLILSETLRQMGRYNEAADIAHRILLFAPDNYEALLAASRAHIADNNAFYAVDLLQQAAKLKPNAWQPQSLLGVAYDQISRPDEATTAFEAALKLSPDNGTVLTNMAMSLATKGRFAEAEPILRKAVAQKTATMQMRQNLALVLGLQGKMDEAEKWLRQDLPPDAVEQNLAWLRNKGQLSPVADAKSNRTWEAVRSGG